jgi:hypothetical protein
MPFNWLSTFHQKTEKSDNYAEKTLAAYRLGIKAGGSIIGVRVEVNPGCCEKAKQIPPDKVYHPDEAPHLPLANCPHGNRCQCVYRPVMKYEKSAE